MQNVFSISDPLGATIVIDRQMLNKNGNDERDMDDKADILDAIVQPSQLIQVSDHELARYYYKVLKNNNTLLICVDFNDNVWRLKTFVEAPTAALMFEITQRGIRLI